LLKYVENEYTRLKWCNLIVRVVFVDVCVTVGDLENFGKCIKIKTPHQY